MCSTNNFARALLRAACPNGTFSFLCARQPSSPEGVTKSLSPFICLNQTSVTTCGLTEGKYLCADSPHPPPIIYVYIIVKYQQRSKSISRSKYTVVYIPFSPLLDVAKLPKRSKQEPLDQIVFGAPEAVMECNGILAGVGKTAQSWDS